MVFVQRAELTKAQEAAAEAGKGAEVSLRLADGSSFRGPATEAKEWQSFVSMNLVGSSFVNASGWDWKTPGVHQMRLDPALRAAGPVKAATQDEALQQVRDMIIRFLNNQAGGPRVGPVLGEGIIYGVPYRVVADGHVSAAAYYDVLVTESHSGGTNFGLAATRKCRLLPPNNANDIDVGVFIRLPTGGA